MQKETIVKEIIARIEKELSVAKQAALDSANEATDEESRPEGKYDTRGLEASYVASAQAYHAKDLIQNLQAYRNLVIRPAKTDDPVSTGSLVTTLSGRGRELFFIGPAHGGIEIESDGVALTVLTPSSPLGSKLIGKRVGAHLSDEGRHTIIRIQ